MSLHREVFITKEIDGRTFVFRKFTAMTGIKLGRLLASKLVLLLKGTELEKLMSHTTGADQDADPASIFDKIEMDLVFGKLSELLESLDDETLVSVITTCLKSTGEQLSGGTARILDEHGNYLIPDIEYDAQLMLVLVVEQIRFGMSDFFSGDRWKALLQRNTSDFLSAV